MNCGGKIRTVFYLLTACVIFISIFACTNANKNSGTTSSGSTSSQQPANSSSQNNTPDGSNINSGTQPETTPAAEQASPTDTTPAPPAPPAPVQQSTPPSQPEASVNVPSGSQSSAGDMIRKEACLMALTKDDLGGEGWVRVSAGPASILYTSSVCHVQYSQGGSFSPTVQNTVAVFRTIQAASNAYDKEKPTFATVSNPAIGDECFLNDSVPISKQLVFRKGNVVVYLWLQQYKTGDIEHYARVVEQRIIP